MDMNQKAFSLVELMIVVAVIGILSSLALPKFQHFQAKARQAEAKTNLKTAFAMEQSHHGDNDTYVCYNTGVNGFGAEVTNWAKNCNPPRNDLGFGIADCSKVRYRYTCSYATVSTFELQAYSGTNDLNRIVPGCAVVDRWRIREDANLLNVSNAPSLCF